LRCRKSDHQEEKGKKTPADDQAVIAIDGQDNAPLKSEDQVIITAAQARFHLVRHPEQSQWRLLNTKLNWGALPNYYHNRQK
jgi:NAD kinase